MFLLLLLLSLPCREGLTGEAGGLMQQDNLLACLPRTLAVFITFNACDSKINTVEFVFMLICSEGLTGEVLADSCIDDLLACLAAADADSMPRTAARVAATGRILSAVSEFSVVLSEFAFCLSQSESVRGARPASRSKRASKRRCCASRRRKMVSQDLIRSSTEPPFSAAASKAD